MFISKALIYRNRDWINRLNTPVSFIKYFLQSDLKKNTSTRAIKNQLFIIKTEIKVNYNILHHLYPMQQVLFLYTFFKKNIHYYYIW